MLFFAAVLLAVSLVLPTLAAPSPLRSVEKYGGQTNGKYIIKFKEGISRKDWITKLNLHSKVVDWDVLNGFAGTF
jgi:cerevisin